MSVTLEGPVAESRFTIGTLRYTRSALAILFFWMLWGDFCFHFMEMVIPKIIPIRLKTLDAPDLVINLYTTTIYYVMNLLMNPIVSFRSDRYRSRWGRRIPFLVVSAPLVTICLILVGFSEDFGGALYGSKIGSWLGISHKAAVLGAMGLFLIAFQFFNMFTSSVYYYLFNDVVPAAFMGRFLSLFRIVGSGAVAVFNWLVFPYAQSHMRAIFIGSALLYLSAFLLMCWRVREGTYPAPPPLDAARNRTWASIRTYFRECFSSRMFVWLFCFNACMYAAQAVIAFQDLFALQIGLTMEQIGRTTAILAIPGLILLYPAGSIVDRIGAVRCYLFLLPLFPLFSVVSFFLVYGYGTWLALAIVAVPLTTFKGVMDVTLNMTVFPRERFGQFASANAMVISVTSIAATVVAGIFLDWAKGFAGAEYYRYIYVWTFFWQMTSWLFLVLFYRLAKSEMPRQQVSICSD